jgi:hypothetical protein
MEHASTRAALVGKPPGNYRRRESFAFELTVRQAQRKPQRNGPFAAFYGEI